MIEPTNLRPITRFITTHNAEGKSVLFKKLTERVPQTEIQGGDAYFALPYVTEQFPVDMTDDKDLDSYSKFLTSAPGLRSAPSRTLDLGIVLEGEIELSLDSGETRRMLPGDQCIQRGTMHAWRNCSDTMWARMIFVLQASQPLVVGGEKLGEDLTDMRDVRASS
ncbi:hypothetical protein B0A55_03113 [Friedmanniomyces simplex]|uniref:Cupin 2 conserved barrel domain-containing protein n=1 Tax=Friedmanniomyces simplex TaxID=329884 RepID=A0A4U0XKY8_9PEZI|nr:hypothetical protein B0A55_03113 [Friedmanniomyces simplex]